MANPEDQVQSPILEAAAHWRDHSLIEDQAVFSQDSIWTMENLRALWVALTADSDEDSGNFLNTLNEKFRDAAPEIPRLCAELLWVMFLSPVPAHIRESRKAEIIKTVHDWSGLDLPISHPLLKKPLAQGIANPGMSFSARRCEELLFLIKAVVAIKKRGAPDRRSLLSAAWKTGRVLDDAAGSSFPQMTHMLRHLLFPQHYEPIFTRRGKRRITESFSGIPRKETKRWSITQLDEELFLIREQLQALYETEDLSFYRDPLVSTWHGGDASSGAPSSERRHWVEMSDVAGRPDRQSGEHALGKAIWAPRRGKDGDDAGALMREVEDGDVIFHFTDNEGITGVSVVTGDMDENFTCLDDTDWRGQPGYRIALQNFTEIGPALQPSAFLSERRFQDELRRLAQSHRSLFFNRQLTLNQGTYLSEAPETLVRILDEAYLEQSKKHLPHLELPESEDLPGPQQQSRETLISSQASNQVLYGPPGTGKTYTAMVRAVEICDGHAPSNHDDLMRRYSALQSANRIRLITFHPSYGYADFIEDAYPMSTTVPEDESERSLENTKPGAFKVIAELARSAEVTRKNPSAISADQPMWKLSLGPDQDAAYRDMVNDGFITLEHGGELNFRSCSSREAILAQLQQVEPATKATDESVSAIYQLTNQMRPGDLVILSDGDLTYRAIGRVTGDYLDSLQGKARTYHPVRPVNWLTAHDESQSWHRISRRKFSQAALYQLDPSMLRLNELTNLLTDTSRQHPDNYVLLIDEMGRGDTARIFGELITLIESDKRAGASNAMSAILPLSGERFDVPANLYLIGTLNSADASCALKDDTLRRRFEFEELMPDASLIRGDDQLGTIPDGNGGRIDLRALMDTINRRIEFMVGRDKTLGHAFFMHIRTFEGLLRAIHHQVIPQLREILDDDWHKIQLIFKDVLGDGRPNRPQIVAHEWQTSASVLGVSHDDIDDQIRFWITPAHELTPEALRKVYHDS